MKSIERYNQLNRPSLQGKINEINTHIPTPSKNHYDLGYIRRYFVQLVNDKNSPIYEVNERVYIKHESKSFYTRASLKWRIAGNLEETYDIEGNLINKSVKESNRIAIKLASKNIPNLKLYLPNLLQFYKN